MHTNRLNRLFDGMRSAELDAVAINPGPTLTYLTGLHFHLSERPTVLLVSLNKEPLLILPELEMGKTQSLSFALQTYPYGDDPNTWDDVFRRAGATLDLDGKSIGVEPNRLRVLELRFLESALPQTNFRSAASTFAALRIQKDAGEVQAMRRAVKIAQNALNATIPLIRSGMKESELASELTLQLLRAGSDPELPFMPIIASGPNSANPHHAFSERPLTPGDLVVIDWGASSAGYFSDLTRTLAVQEVDAEFSRIVEVVAQANASGRAAGKPGLPAGNVDRAAREVIDASGYGPYFIHRTGHGLGMETHEEPYMYAGNPLILQTGMVYTVEPGIYLPGRGGVRIEDNVVVTDTGAETLSDLPRQLIIVG